MAACASCLKSVCDCQKIEREPYNGELITQPCPFALGLHKNVTVEIGHDCKVIRMVPADTEEVYLCDPCPAGLEDSEPEAGYDQGYSDAEDIFRDIGYNEGFTEGKEQGILIGKAEGYSEGLANGDSSGYDRGFADGRADVDCESEYTRGYDEGLEEGKGLAPLPIGDVLSELDKVKALQVKFNNTDAEEVIAVIAQNEDGEYVSSYEPLIVNAETGEVDIDPATVEAGTTIKVSIIELDG